MHRFSPAAVNVPKATAAPSRLNIRTGGDLVQPADVDKEPVRGRDFTTGLCRTRRAVASAPSPTRRRALPPTTPAAHFCRARPPRTHTVHSHSAIARNALAKDGRRYLVAQE